MASATAPPTPVSISSKTRVGAEPLSASTTFSASMKRESSPPEATFISGPGLRAGIGLGPELDPVEPGRIAALLVRRDLGDEAGALEPQRRQLRLHRAVERLRGAPPAGRERPRRGDVGGVGLGDRALERGELLLAGVDRRDVGGEALAQRRRARRPARRICAPRRAARTAAPRPARARADRTRLRGSPPRGRARASSIATSAASSALTQGSTSAGACAPRRSSLRSAADERRHRRALAGDGLEGVGEVLRHLLGLHHDEAALGERRLLAGLRRERAELLDGVAQEIGLLAGALDPGAMLVQRRPRLAHRRAPPRRRRAPRPAGRRRRRGSRGASPDRRARGRRAGRGSRRAPRRSRAAPAR